MNREPTFKQSLLCGFKSLCPACGNGNIFKSFLKVSDKCPSCGEELHHHQADDFPAYIVMVIVGHIIGPLLLFTLKNYDWPNWAHYITWLPLGIFLSIILLQPVKGAIVAWQWFDGMHDFADAKKKRDLKYKLGKK